MGMFRTICVLLLLFCPFRALTKSSMLTDHGTPIVMQVVPMTWKFACSFPEDKKEAVRNGFRYWQSLTTTRLFKESVSCDRIGLSLGTIVVEYKDSSREGSTPESFTLAQTARMLGGAAVVLTFYREWADPDNVVDQATVARHEVGHILGLDHSTDTRCLMYASIQERANGRDGVACKAELRLFRRYYGPRRY